MAEIWKTINGHFFEIKNGKAICKFCDAQLKSASFINVPFKGKVPDIIGWIFCPRR